MRIDEISFYIIATAMLPFPMSCAAFIAAYLGADSQITWVLMYLIITVPIGVLALAFYLSAKTIYRRLKRPVSTPSFNYQRAFAVTGFAWLVACLVMLLMPELIV